MRRNIGIIGIVALFVTGACAVAYFGFLFVGCFTGYRTSSITPQKCEFVDTVMELSYVVDPFSPSVRIPPVASVIILAVVAVALAVLIVRQVRGRPGGG